MFPTNLSRQFSMVTKLGHCRRQLFFSQGPQTYKFCETTPDLEDVRMSPKRVISRHLLTSKLEIHQLPVSLENSTGKQRANNLKTKKFDHGLWRESIEVGYQGHHTDAHSIMIAPVRKH